MVVASDLNDSCNPGPFRARHEVGHTIDLEARPEGDIGLPRSDVTHILAGRKDHRIEGLEVALREVAGCIVAQQHRQASDRRSPVGSPTGADRHLMTAGGQPKHSVRADETGPADNQDLHGPPPLQPALAAQQRRSQDPTIGNLTLARHKSTLGYSHLIPTTRVRLRSTTAGTAAVHGDE